MAQEVTRKTTFLVKDFSAEQVQDWLERGEVLLVDVREPREYEAEHIAGALLLPLSSLDADYFPVLPGRRVVLHCAIGKRSEAAAKILLKAGHVSIAHMAGGLAAWKARGLETELPLPVPVVPKPRQNVPHPGKVLLQDYISGLGQPLGTVADRLGVSLARFEALIAGKAALDSDMALRLARMFSTEADFWMQLQVRYDLAHAKMALQADAQSVEMRKVS